ncbi:MAG TPA: histidine--tRNA ligase [Candidatus Dormibacteraeota bacterium]|nr:histidine--tRNA ligase [Candidatus Dormibacteraeota bacterium]
MPRFEPIRSVRGVRDILPADFALWRAAKKAGRTVARSFGYEEIETPIIEPSELIERVGEDTDAVAKELYRFEDRGGRSVALRPEATAGVVRAYFEGRLNQGPQPSRLYLFGPMFRYDRPQKGRYRQFFQFDVEAVGSAASGVDAEVIEIAARWLEQVGLDDPRLELNTIGDRKCRPGYLEKLKEYYRPLKSQLHGDCQLRLERNPLRLLDCKVPQCQPFKEGAPKITDNLCEECAKHWSEVRGLLDAAGLEYILNPHLVRGLDYYTRTVFEFYPSGATGQQDALASGGRYDDLAEDMNWPPTPAVGFAGGLDRVTELMASPGDETPLTPPADVLVLPDGDLGVEAATVARICRAVRSTAVDYEPKSLRAKMRSANKLGARWVVLLSAEDAARRVAQLKEMSSGDQAELGWHELPARLR